MIVVNFSHPLGDCQVARIEQLCNARIQRVASAPARFDETLSFSDQAVRLVDATGMSADEWQTERLVLVPPSLAAIACLVIAEIHGRAGYFVPIARLSPRPDSVPPVFDVVEILDLATQRATARSRR